MSKRTERRAAERANRKLAYQQLRQQPAPSASIAAHTMSPEQLSPISEAQLAANRANAQLSCGPKSSEGKSVSSQNALKHGLTSQTVVLAGEDQALYNLTLQTHIQRYQPATDEELRLVQSIVDHHWRISRCLRIETALLRKGELEFADKFPDHDPSDQAFLSLADLYLKYEKPLRNLHTQENRLRRSLEKDTAALRELQANRKREEQLAATDPHEYPATLPLPTTNGFVFSTAPQHHEIPVSDAFCNIQKGANN